MLLVKSSNKYNEKMTNFILKVIPPNAIQFDVYGENNKQINQKIYDVIFGDIKYELKNKFILHQPTNEWFNNFISNYYYMNMIQTNRDGTILRHGVIVVGLYLDTKVTKEYNFQIMIAGEKLKKIIKISPNEIVLPLNGTHFIPLIGLQFHEVRIIIDNDAYDHLYVIYAFLHTNLRRKIAQTAFMMQFDNENALFCQNGLGFFGTEDVSKINIPHKENYWMRSYK